MQVKWLGRGAFAALVVGVCSGSGLLAGCAEERDPINRVQSGALSKSFFLGGDLEGFKDDPEFRTKSFNIDSGANTSSHGGAIGGASAIERVRWEVTENFLFARRAYQESPGADARGKPRVEVSPGKWEFPAKADGTIVAAYRIESHFDVRRSYNAATGEEQNVIEENRNDRPWNKREYMRVNWSMNMADSTSGDTSWVFGADSSATAVEYNASSESDEDRPHFEPEKGYFDVTNKFQMKNEGVAGRGSIPECALLGFYTGTTSYDCTPQEVKVRSSYVRLTGEEDFEPFEESKAARDIVGNWGNAGNNMNREYGAAPITAWDPQYGYTDAKTKTFYAIHNLWEKSHQDVACGSNVDEDKDGTADECKPEITQYRGSAGSQCDIYSNKCTLPVRDRKVKTTAYWLNTETPVELTDDVSADGKTITRGGPVEEMTVTWNQIFKVAVATRREVECRRTHDGDRDGCHELYFEGGGAAGKQMIAFGGWGVDTTKPQDSDKGADGKDIPLIATCHNPVRAYDLAMCGKPGEVTRLGDLRKNYAIYWPYASRAPYGGVASIAGDPLTGEMLGVTATTMLRSANQAAAQQRDIIGIANGDVKIEDLILGVQATNYASRVKDGKITDGLAQAKTPEEIFANTHNLDQASISAAVGENPATLKAMETMDRQLKAALTRTTESPMTNNIAKANADLEALMTMANATPYKTELANKGLLRLVAESGDKTTPLFSSIKQMADQGPEQMQKLLDQYQAYLGNKGVCFMDEINGAGAGSIYQPSLAPYYKKLYGDLDPIERGVKIYKDLLRESTKGIAFHEIGHSLGLRHNFSSSWDTFNYTPQYWQLRTNEGQSTAKCTGPRNGGADNCMGPRYLDPMTDDEQGVAGEARPGIDYYANTSTMEYHIERFGETIGAGTYDLHAIKTLYGRVLETFDTREVKADEQQYFALKMLSQGISSDLIFQPGKGYGLHYTTAALKAKVFDPKRDCRDATPEEKEVARWRIVHGKICSQSPKNHLAYEDMKSDPIAFKIRGQTTQIGSTGVRWSGVDENGTKLVRWHFRYGEDYSSGGYMHAHSGDSGGDVYEITMNAIRRFDATYPWSYFRRQNKEWAWWGLPGGVGGTFARFRGYHWSTTTAIGRATAADLEDDDQERPAAMASAEMFNFLQRVIMTPEPGTYGAGAETTRRSPFREGALPVFDVQTATEAKDPATAIGTLGLVDGRFVNVDFDNSKGGSWDYQKFPEHAPFEEEKVLALKELVDSRPTLGNVSRDNALDGRDPYISFRSDTPQAIDRLLGGILSEDWETVAPSMSADGKSPVGFDLRSKDAGSLRRAAGTKGILFPNLGYGNQLGSSMYALIFSRFSTDMNLANKLRVRREGDNGPPIPADRKVAFTDPVTGTRYIALRFGNETIQGRAVETGIASRMIQHVNDLGKAAYVLADNTVSANGEYNYATTGTQPRVADPAAEKALRRYIGLLDAMRQIGNMYGGGPIGNGGGD